MNVKEDVKLLINEGIEFLDSTVGRLNASEKIQLKDFNEYIKRFSQVSAQERLDYFCNSEKTKEEAKKITETFNSISNYLKEQHSKHLYGYGNMFTEKEFKIVCIQYINMLTNNLQLNDLRESFIGWCEDGNVFYFDEDLSKDSQEKCCILMKHLEEKLDSFTNTLADTYDEICQEDIEKLDYEKLSKLQDELRKNCNSNVFWKSLVVDQIISNLDQKDNCSYNIKQTDIEKIADKVTSNNELWQTLDEVIGRELIKYETIVAEEEEDSEEDER